MSTEAPGLPSRELEVRRDSLNGLELEKPGTLAMWQFNRPVISCRIRFKRRKPQLNSNPRHRCRAHCRDVEFRVKARQALCESGRASPG
jgi:hypothetical protein